MLGHKSIRSFRGLSQLIKVSFARGVEADINRERIRRETALAFKERERAYRQKLLEVQNV